MEEYNFLLDPPRLGNMTKVELYELINRYKQYIKQTYEINQTRDINLIVKKLKTSLETAHNFIEQLKQKNVKLQIDNKILLDQKNLEIKQLKDEINKSKESDNLHKFKNALSNLNNNTQFIDIVNVDKIIDENCLVLSKLQPNKFTDTYIDVRLKIIPDQINNEKNIIESLKNILYDYLENIIDNTIKRHRDIVKLDINNILIKISDCKDRLSLYLKEEEYNKFINTLIKDMNKIMNLFNINTLGDITFNFEISSYDKWILNKNDYIFYCDNHCDNIQRLVLNNIPGNKLEIFSIFSSLDKYYLVSPIYLIAEYLLITTSGINNITYVPTETKDCFLILENISNEHKYWKKDTFLINTIRNISKKFNFIFKQEFRKFYKDCLGHNNYIDNFEQILSNKGIKRWKNYKILYDNIRTVSDEYMFGEIVREIIRTKCIYTPDNNDKIKNDNQDKNIIKDFQNAYIKFSKGLPYIDEQEYFIDLFDDLTKLNEEKHIQEYNERWKQFLFNYYK
jgi:hypothetical protein